MCLVAGLRLDPLGSLQRSASSSWIKWRLRREGREVENGRGKMESR